MNELMNLMSQIQTEMKRVKEITHTLQGSQKLISIFENQFNRKYEHGDNLVYEVARVNVLRILDNLEPLC